MFSVLAFVLDYYLETTLEKFDLVFVISAVIYASFMFGWAISYTTFFKFPDNQEVILFGIIIAALIFPVITGFSGLVSGQIEITKWLSTVPKYLVGNLIGAAAQLYFLVIVLRYLFRRRLTF